MIPFIDDLRIPDEPEWVTLTSDETILWSGRPTIIMFWREIGSAIGLILFGILSWAIEAGYISLSSQVIAFLPLTLLAVLLILAGLGSLVGTVLQWLSIQYVVTTEEIYVKRGVVSRQAVNTRLDRVYNTEFHQGVLGRLLSFGDVQIQTAGTGGTDVYFRMVDDPQGKTELITRERDEPGSADPEGN